MRPEDEALKQAQLKHMKRLATGMLLLATAIFIVARLFEPQFPWLGFVRATAEAGMASFAHHLPDTVSEAELLELLAGLPRGWREAVVLRHVEGLPYAEVAEVLGRPVGTVKTHVHRGVRQLREDLEAREERVRG